MSGLLLFRAAECRVRLRHEQHPLGVQLCAWKKRLQLCAGQEAGAIYHRAGSGQVRRAAARLAHGKQLHQACANRSRQPVIARHQREVRLNGEPVVRGLAVIGRGHALHLAGEGFHVAPQANVLDHRIGVSKVEGVVGVIKRAGVTDGCDEQRSIIRRAEFAFSEIDQRYADVLASQEIQPDPAPVIDAPANIEDLQGIAFARCAGDDLAQQIVAPSAEVVGEGGFQGVGLSLIGASYQPELCGATATLARVVFVLGRV